MTVLPMRPSPAAAPDDSFIWERQLRPVLDAIIDQPHAPPRALLVGNAGSGKSASLRRLRDVLLEEGRDVHLLHAGMRADPAIPPRMPPDTVLIVDDAQLLDDEQLDVIVDRAADPHSALIVAHRPWPAPERMRSIQRLLERTFPAVVLGHVARSDVLQHLEASGQPIRDTCLQHILQATGGVTWLVSEALALHDDRDCTDDDAHSALHGALGEHVAHRLETVEPELRLAVERLCTASAKGRASGLLDAIQRAHAEGLLLRSGMPVPLVLAAVRTAMPAQPDDEKTDAVRRARDAWADGDLDTAMAIVDDAATDAHDREQLADISAGGWAARGMMAQADAVYRALPPGDADSATLAMIAAIGTGSASLADTATMGTAAPTVASAAPSTLSVAMDLLRRGLAASVSGNCSEAVLADLVRAAEMYTGSRATRAVPELPAVVATIVALNLGALVTAHTVIDDAIRDGHGGAWARPRLLLWRAWVSVQRARPAEAFEDLARAQEIAPAMSARDTLLARAVRVAIARRYEDAAGIEEAWRHARGTLLRTDIDLFLLHPLAELISSATRAGDAERIDPHITRALEITAGLGDPPLWIAHLRWAGIQQGILLGSPARVAPHAKALVAASAGNRVAAVMAKAGRVWTSVLGGTVDPAAVETAAEGLASVGLKWDGARLAGHGAGRTDDRKVAARLLACARDLHPTDIARRSVDADPVGDGERTTPEEILSDREIEVARLVLQGKTYAEIGETIFISPRTAEHHIAHIRTRLGATSRSEVIARLRQLIGDESPSLPLRASE